MMSNSDKLEAAFTKEARSPLSWLLSAARKAPTWSKGKASLPLRHAAGQWMTHTGDLASQVGSFGTRNTKPGGKISEFAKTLINKGDDMHLEGLRQSGISDRIMPRLKPMTKYQGGFWNPVSRGKHVWDTKGEIGTRLNPLNIAKGIHRRGVGTALNVGFAAGVPGAGLGALAYMSPYSLAAGGGTRLMELAMLPGYLSGPPGAPKPRNFKYNNIVRNPQALRRYT
jgi:hypothetical protein